MGPAGAGISGLPSCPGFCCWGHREGGTLSCPNCLFPGTFQPLQGLRSGRLCHCIQLGFSSLMVVSRTHPDSMLIQPLEFSPYVLPKFEVGAKGQWIERVGGGHVSCLAGCCALPASSPLKRTMLSYSSLLPLLIGWRCLLAVLFSVLAPTGQHQNLLERQKPRKILSKQLLPVALPGYLSLGWPEPSRGKAVVLSCGQVPKPSALWSHLQLITSWMSPQHRSLRTALPSLPAPHPPHSRGRTALSPPALGGRAEQLLLVSLSPLPAEKDTLSAVLKSSGERHC